MRLVDWFKRKTCKHEFVLSGIKQTGIPEPPVPKGSASCAEWNAYFVLTQSLEHESHTKRVEWACDKCGKVFYAHCGLDILGTHGKIK